MRNEKKDYISLQVLRQNMRPCVSVRRVYDDGLNSKKFFFSD